MENIFVTGYSGNVGSAVVKYLKKTDVNIFVGLRRPDKYQAGASEISIRHFDFEDHQTYHKALEGMDRVFLVRPPHITDIKGVFDPLIKVCKEMEIKHIVFLSLIGIEKNTIPPHHKIEQCILASGIPYTFIRPSFFMQNLIEPHGQDIRNYNQLMIPAGDSKTNFIDTDDIGEIIQKVMVGEDHFNKAYDITGSEALTYHHIGMIMSDVLERPISYEKPSFIRFYRHMTKHGYKGAQVRVMVFLYLSTRLGMSNVYSDDAKMILGREPHSFRRFVQENKHIWLPV